MLKYHKYYLVFATAFLLFFSSFDISLAVQRAIDGFEGGGGTGYGTPAYGTPWTPDNSYYYPTPNSGGASQGPSQPSSGGGNDFTPGVGDGSNDSSTWGPISTISRWLRAARAAALAANNPSFGTSFISCLSGGPLACVTAAFSNITNIVTILQTNLNNSASNPPSTRLPGNNFGSSDTIIGYEACTLNRDTLTGCNVCCMNNNIGSSTEQGRCREICQDTFKPTPRPTPLLLPGGGCDSALNYACSLQGKICAAGSCVAPTELSFSENFDTNANGDPIIRICIGDNVSTCQWHLLEDLPQYFAENNLQLTRTFLTTNTGRLNDIWHSYCVQNPYNTDVCGNNHDITSDISPSDLNSREFNTLVEFYLTFWASNPASIINEYLEITQLKNDPVARQILTTYLANGGHDITGGSIEGFELAYAMETHCNNVYNGSTYCNIYQTALMLGVPIGIANPAVGIGWNAGTNFVNAYYETRYCERVYGSNSPECEGYYLAAAESLALDAILQKLGGHTPINSVDFAIDDLLTPEFFSSARFASLSIDERFLLADAAKGFLTDEEYLAALRNAAAMPETTAPSINLPQRRPLIVQNPNLPVYPEWNPTNQWSFRQAESLPDPIPYRFPSTSEDALVMTSRNYQGSMDNPDVYIVNINRRGQPASEFIREEVATLDPTVAQQFVREIADPNSLIIEVTNIDDGVQIIRQLREEGNTNIVLSISEHGGTDRVFLPYENQNVGIATSSLSGNQLGRVLAAQGLPEDVPVVMLSCWTGYCAYDRTALIQTVSEVIPNPVYGPNGILKIGTNMVTDSFLAANGEAAVGTYTTRQGMFGTEKIFTSPVNPNDIFRVAQGGDVFTMYGELPPGLSLTQVVNR
jgi:hypothetical protein